MSKWAETGRKKAREDEEEVSVEMGAEVHSVALLSPQTSPRTSPLTSPPHIFPPPPHQRNAHKMGFFPLLCSILRVPSLFARVFLAVLACLLRVRSAWILLLLFLRRCKLRNYAIKSQERWPKSFPRQIHSISARSNDGKVHY